MERIITERLSYELEKRGMQAIYQSGFRKGRNKDSVIRLETAIRNAWANDESVLAGFFDIEKAYDTM